MRLPVVSTSTDHGMFFLKAPLPIAKRRMPKPRRHNVIGQGSGQLNKGFGMPATIIIESMINSTPAIMNSHFDAVNIIHFPHQFR